MAAETYRDYLANQADRDRLGQATVSEDYWQRAYQAMQDRQAIESVAQYQEQQAEPFQSLLARNADNLAAIDALAPAEQAAHVKRTYEPLSRSIDARNKDAAGGYGAVTDMPSWYVPPTAGSTIQAGQAAGELNYGTPGALTFAEGGSVGRYDERAHMAATSPFNDRREPTEAQKRAGNYKKGLAYVNGMRVSIENPQGSIRRGKSKAGEDWASPLFAHYGYLRGTTGRDKDHIDSFLGPMAGDGDLPVFVIDQVDPETGEFDEHKVMLGYADEDSAAQGYLQNYPDDWAGLGAVTSMPLGAFKKWAFQPGRRVKALSGEIAHYAKGGQVRRAYAEGGSVDEAPAARPEWADKLDAILAANSGSAEESANNKYQYIDEAGKVYTPASYGYVSVDESDPRQQHETKIANDYDSTGANLGEREYEHKGGFSGFWEDSGPALMMMLTPMLGAAGLSVTGALSNGIASATGLSPGMAGALSQAITSGVQAELGGGDFLKGAASGAVGSFMPSVGNATADAALRGGAKALIGGGNPLMGAASGAVGSEFGAPGQAAMKLLQGRIPVRELLRMAQEQGGA